VRKNNFDILRLLCALLVIVSHSWALTCCDSHEPLYMLSSGRLVCSAIGLCGFFTISGYLIYQSLMNSRNIGNYIEKRWLRIFPGLAVCLLVTLFACSWVYEGGGCYWLNSSTWSYLWRNLTLYDVAYDIPGVFENNIYGPAINGSLWTLCYEFTMYLLIIPLFFIKKKYIQVILPILVLGLVLLKNVLFADKFVHSTFMCYMGLNQFTRFAQFFAVGVVIAILEKENVVNNNWYQSKWVAALCVGLCVLCICFNQIALGLLFLSVLFIQLGKNNWEPISSGLKRVGDLSYGVYIYGFVVQQFIICILPNTPPLLC